MKNCVRLLVLIIVSLFSLSQLVVAGQPAVPQKLQSNQLKVAPKNLKKPVRIKPDLSVIGLQVAQTQYLDRLRYQVKIRNNSKMKYTGGDPLILNVKYHIQAQNKDAWTTVKGGKTLGPIEPGGEVNLAGEFIRLGNYVSLKAAVMADNQLLASRTMKLPDMPVPDVRITSSQCNGSQVLSTIKNMSNYHIGAGLVLQYYLKANGSSEYAPNGGTTIKLQPGQKGTVRKAVTPGGGFLKVTLFHTRSETIKGAEAIVDLNTCN